jgi:hypothetical protein
MPSCDRLLDRAEEWVLMLAEHTHEDAPLAVREALATLAHYLDEPEWQAILNGSFGAWHEDRCAPIDWGYASALRTDSRGSAPKGAPGTSSRAPWGGWVRIRDMSALGVVQAVLFAIGACVGPD